MTRIQNPTIQIPSERLDQIKAIGAALGTQSIADTIGHLVRAEIERGTIPDTLPGISISKAGDTVMLALDDDLPVRMTQDRAKELAQIVLDYADGTERVQKLMNMDSAALDSTYVIARQGNGIKLTIPLKDGTTKSFSRDVARDFARILDAAAA